MGKNKRKFIKEEISENELNINDNNNYKKIKLENEVNDLNDLSNPFEIHDEFISQDSVSVADEFDDDDVEELTCVLQPVPEDIEAKWSKEDLQKLLSRIQEFVPKNDTAKYSTTLEKLDWDSIKFDDHDAQECQTCFSLVLNKVRKFRTLSEILVDCHSWTASPFKSSTTHRVNHPDLPKKPLSIFLRYFKDKRSKIQAQNPTITLRDLSKIIGEKFKSLSEKKKAKYRKIYEEELIEYKKKMEQFKEEHPELYQKTRKKPPEKPSPVKPRTPFQLFKNKYLKKIENPDEQGFARIRELWNNKSEKKHYKFIKKSLKDQERYKKELEEYLKNVNPNYKPPPLKPLLNKHETELRYKFEGMPEKPPNSGYMLFSKMMLKEVKDVPAREKMVLIAKRWKEMTDDERKKFNEDAHKMMSKYIVEFDEFLQNLPEEEREKIFMDQKFKLPSEQKMKTKINNNNNLENTAMIAFQMEEMNRIKAEQPTMHESEIMELVNDKWQQFNDGQKFKYTQMAKSIQNYMNKPDNENSKSSNSDKNKNSSKTKSKDLKAEEFFRKTGLKKIQPNGYVAFCQEILKNKNHLVTQDRLKYASIKWGEMDNKMKERYNQMAKKRFSYFNQFFNRFKQTGELPTEQEKKLIENCTIEENDNKSSSKKKQSSSNNDQNKNNIILSITPTKNKKESNPGQKVDIENNENNSSSIMKTKNSTPTKQIPTTSTNYSKTWNNIMYQSDDSSSSDSD